MKPPYEKYRKKPEEKATNVNALVPDHLKSVLDFVAAEEKDSFTGLVLEGLGRVLEDRVSDPEFHSRYMSHLDSESERIEEARRLFTDSLVTD
jgi:hypothetical protein